jgi:cytochrome P450
LDAGIGEPILVGNRYDDIVRVFCEPNLSSSMRGLIVPSSPEMEELTPEMMGAGDMMIMTDPPLHGAMRRAFNRLFLPRPVGKYESPGQLLVAEILDEVMKTGNATSSWMWRRGCRWRSFAR